MNTEIWNKLNKLQKKVANINHPNVKGIVTWFTHPESRDHFNKILSILGKNNNTIIEICLHGMTHYLWKQISKQVITINASFNNVMTTYYLLKTYDNIQGSYFIIDDPSLLNTYERVRQLLNGNLADVLYVDSSVEYEHCKAYYEYSELVKKGGIVLFRGYLWPNSGVKTLIDELKIPNIKFLNEGVGWACYKK